MTLRSFRLPDTLYFAARDKAHAEGTDLAKIVREKLEEYVNEPECGKPCHNETPGHRMHFNNDTGEEWHDRPQETNRVRGGRP